MEAALYMNRELSWLEFNRRVLEEAQDPEVPLLERLKFLAIVSSNLDEFFMVRVAALQRRVMVGDTSAGPDGLSPLETLHAIAERARELSDEQHHVFLHELAPLMAAEGIHLVKPPAVSDEQRSFLEDYLHRVIVPVLTPLAMDPGHPFPHLGNRSIYLVASIRANSASLLPDTQLALVHVPSQVVPRFVALPGPSGEQHFMLLEDVVRMFLPRLYRGYDVLSCHALRVTRDAAIDTVRGGKTTDLLSNVEAGLRERRMGSAVRLQYDRGLPADVLAVLVPALELDPEDLYPGEGFPAFADLFQLYSALNLPHLKDVAMKPRPVPGFEAGADLWATIRAGDVMVHHPYESFDVVTRFVREAAIDPKVLAIKMTLYRVSPTSPIAQALTLAAEQGKNVAVLVELQARFDEEANIRWARALEAVGAHVVYGLPGYKTHCKACLVVRQEDDGIRRYCHVATGNYNAKTAGLYTDLGLFTCRDTFGADLTELFNTLTGYMRPRAMHHMLMAPTDLRNGLVARVRREADNARAGRPAKMILKMNSLVDPVLIEELYEASRAGVDIELIVRGISCLRPGVAGASERIRLISIIDRYLEHARVFYFENAGDPEYWMASADWMPRNLDHRVELAFPVLDPNLRLELRRVLDVQLADTEKAREIRADGSSQRLRATSGTGKRSQELLHAPPPSAAVKRDRSRAGGALQTSPIFAIEPV
ncbi:MAG TPA: polyphosphate kinase 1 [Polyangiales bacterium]|nr:polyphosphate kinase 1 [Polyangiales bacterium]